MLYLWSANRLSNREEVGAFRMSPFSEEAIRTHLGKRLAVVLTVSVTVVTLVSACPCRVGGERERDQWNKEEKRQAVDQ